VLEPVLQVLVDGKVDLAESDDKFMLDYVVTNPTDQAIKVRFLSQWIQYIDHFSVCAGARARDTTGRDQIQYVCSEEPM